MARPPHRPHDQVVTLTGTSGHVAEQLRAAHAAGALLWLTPPAPGTQPGTVQVTASVRGPQTDQKPAAARTTLPRLPGRVKAGMAAAALAALAVLTWAAVTALDWLTDHATTALGAALITATAATAAYRATHRTP